MERTSSAQKRRLLLAGGTLLLLGSVAAAAGLGVMTAASASATADLNGTGGQSSASPSGRCANDADYDTFESSDKESPYAFGPDVTVRSKSSVIKALRDFTCVQPVAARAVVAAFDDDYSGLNDCSRSYVKDEDAWRSDVADMLDKARSAEFAIVAAPAGRSSLYMTDDSACGAPVKLAKGTTSHSGTAAKFTLSDGTVVKLRLDCHFQPYDMEVTPNVPNVPGTPTSTPSPSHPTPKPSKTLEAKVPSQDPAARGNAKQGGGTNTGLGEQKAPTSSDRPPATSRENPQPPAAESTGSSGSSGSSGSGSSSGSSGGSSGGSTAPSSAPAPSQRSTPPPETGAPTATDPGQGCVDPTNSGVCG